MKNNHPAPDNSPRSRLIDLHANADAKTITRLALNGEELETVKHTLRTMLAATKEVLRADPLPPPVRLQRRLEIEAMERALTTIVEQSRIGGG